MTKQKLFQKDFTLMVSGQIISLFGNAILRFALSLYIWDQTGSATAFGGILAISMIPTILLCPFGGMLADRMSRKNIMVILDFLTAFFVLAFFAVFRLSDSLAPITVIMIILAIIQSFYQPSVQASIPSLVDDGNLMQANGIVSQVNALANLVGPIIGSFLYAFFGAGPIIIVSGICFFFSAVMELFLHIPYTKQSGEGSALQKVKDDFLASANFLVKENPAIFRLLLIIAALNMFLSALITVGLPYIINVFFSLSDQHYGFSQAALGIGTIAGSLFAGAASKRVRVKQSYLFLLATSLLILPIAGSVLSSRAPDLSYIIIVASIILTMGFTALFNIFMITYMQRETPSEMLGKVNAFVTVISMCALPFGQFMYGRMFDTLHPAPVFLLGCLFSIIITILSGRFLADIKD